MSSLVNCKNTKMKPETIYLRKLNISSKQDIFGEVKQINWQFYIKIELSE